MARFHQARSESALRAEAECRTELADLRLLVKQLRGTLGFAAQYVAKANADGAYDNTTMSGDRALRIINETLKDTETEPRDD